MSVTVTPTETKRQRTTRVTSRAMPSKVSRRDYALVEAFVFEHGRYPESRKDGPAYWARQRGIADNLAAQTKTPVQPWESTSTVAWRQRTAAKALVALAKTSHQARQIVKKAVAVRNREPSSKRQRGDATSRGGDSGDPSRSPDDGVARPRRAAERAREQSTAERSRSAWRASIVASDLSAKARLIALVLSIHWERNGGVCASSVATLARESGLSYRAVQYALSELDRAGFVERERGGRGKPTRYRGTNASGALVREGSP